MMLVNESLYGSPGDHRHVTGQYNDCRVLGRVILASRVDGVTRTKLLLLMSKFDLFFVKFREHGFLNVVGLMTNYNTDAVRIEFGRSLYHVVDKRAPV